MNKWTLRDLGDRSITKKRRIGIQKGLHQNELEIVDLGEAIFAGVCQPIGYIYMENDKIIVSGIRTHPQLTLFDCVKEKPVETLDVGGRKE